jgi:hypothetical protein
MANLPAAFPKVNLVKNNTDRVSVSVWLPRGNEAAEGIAASIGSTQTKVQIAQYRRSKTEHYVTQFFLLQPDETDQYVMVDVKYDLQPGPFHASQRFADKALAPFLEELLDAQPSMVHRNISMFLARMISRACFSHFPLLIQMMTQNHGRSTNFAAFAA